MGQAVLDGDILFQIHWLSRDSIMPAVSLNKHYNKLGRSWYNGPGKLDYIFKSNAIESLYMSGPMYDILWCVNNFLPSMVIPSQNSAAAVLQ
jgi:hypothetical protein